MHLNKLIWSFEIHISESIKWLERIENIVKDENPNIKISTKIRLIGVVIYGEILQQAEKEHIKLIVIGRREKSEIKKLLFGSQRQV